MSHLRRRYLGNNQDKDSFIATINATSGETLSLSFTVGTINFSVDWGDGVYEEFTTTGSVTHTYNSTGGFQLKVKGTLHEFRISSPLLTSIKQWGKLNTYKISFSGCSNLSSIPNSPITIGDSTTYISLSWLFKDCTSLLSIPDNLFENGHFVTDLSYAFQNSGISGAIPNAFFSDCTQCTSFSGVFYGCADLVGEIPGDLFSNCAKAASFNSAFSRATGLTSIGTGLFDTCYDMTNAAGVFYGCTGLTGSIPAGLFKNKTKLVYIASGGAYSGAFYGCKGLTGSIPADLFQGCTSLSYISNNNVGASLFANCTGLTGSIPSTLFADCTDITRIVQCFYNCSGLTGFIPESLFSKAYSVTSYKQVFMNCTGLTGGIPSGLFSNSSNATDFTSTFQGCTGLNGSIGSGLFTNTSATNLTATFRGCSNLTGSIPTGLFDGLTEVTTFAGCFYGCKSITGSIPTGLFKDNLKTTSMDAVFFDCSGLTGSIPNGLFAGMSQLVYVASGGAYNSAFSGCSGLTGSIPVDLFQGCTSLQWVSHSNYKSGLFRGCKCIDGIVPADLFKDCPNIEYAANLFSGTNITGVENGLFRNQSKLKNAQGIFGNCANLNSVPSDILTAINNPAIENLNYFMVSCSGYTANVPELWNESFVNLTSHTACFIGCSNAQNYGSIPADWK